MKRTALVLLAALAAGSLAPRDAHAFCGFYVSGADAKLFNDATMVVMMRDGTKTVLAMQNNYQGPPQDFAMVVPVPVVLRKQNVKTLPREVFDHVDQLTAPRLVEYWEQDPCGWQRMEADRPGVQMMAPQSAAAPTEASERRGVKIEAKFSVGEYEIVVLSAKDSGGLDTWLHEEGYKIPNGSEPLLRPYVQQGMKFFVAKVDVKKVAMKGNATMLSPLRFHFDSDAFFLPIRLGLVNSNGTQDLIVSILARGQRYEVANYDNVSIPTNINVAEDAKTQFGAFYAALFDKTVAGKPRAVVTEYSWDAGSCDPCPTPALSGDELMTLGADVISANDEEKASWSYGGGFVVTRLHLRYGKTTLGDDLFFRVAPPIEGGRETLGQDGHLERGSHPASINNFQARYSIRHPWTGAIECKDPRRGIWGGPPNGGGIATTPATNLAFAPRGQVQLSSLIKDDSPEGVLLSQGGPTPPIPIPKGGGCAGCAMRDSKSAEVQIAGGAFGVLALVSWLRRRRGTEHGARTRP